MREYNQKLRPLMTAFFNILKLHFLLKYALILIECSYSLVSLKRTLNLYATRAKPLKIYAFASVLS